MGQDVTDGCAEKITKRRLVYRALTGSNGKTRFAMSARAARPVRPNEAAKVGPVIACRQLSNQAQMLSDDLEAMSGA
jgi:hypothetical protein